MTFLHEMAQRIADRREAIDTWFKQKARIAPPPLFLSCDLRHSGHKIAVVDANLFPAGFNNLCSTYTDQSIAACRRVMDSEFQKARSILLLAETHTRNKFYFENLCHLAHMIEACGRQVRIGMIEPPFDEPLPVDLCVEKKIVIYPITERDFKQDRITWSDFTPDAIISNNDFSTPLPTYWEGLSQAIHPSPLLGWNRRRKSQHFTILNKLSEEFAHLTGIDPWQITCYFDQTNDMDVNEANDRKQLSDKASALLLRIEETYTRHGIRDTPYLFVKSDSGTYGMGITTVQSFDDLEQMNRKIRSKMLSSKGGRPNTRFILQEGIPTVDFYSDQPIEPVIYMIGGEFSGGFFRINPTRDAYSSLNSPGMQFSCLCLHKIDEPHEVPFIQCSEKKDLVTISAILTHISALAAGLEALEV